MTSTSKASPFLKWAGSKRRLVPELLALVPSRFGRYYEPFAGGAALFFALAPERAVLGDVNADLVATYRAVATEPAAVVRGLRRHVRSHSARHFYGVRDLWRRRSSWSAPRVAAAFIYLNKTCFNGLWRVNRAGHFNCPMGRYEKPAICEPAILSAAHAALQRTELRVGDFRQTVADAKPNDLLYLDCPYMPTSSTSNFTSYSRDGFNVDDQRALADTARQLVARGCHVLLTNSDTPIVRSLYAGFKIDVVQCARSINSDVGKRGHVNELIIHGTPTASRVRR